MSRQRSIRLLFSLILVAFTFALSEVTFRAYDYFTTPRATNVDEWVRTVSKQLEDHPSLGYRRVPNQRVDEFSQVDRFGMLNAREALAWDRADVIGIGDSYVEAANRVFFERFNEHGLKYHSLALFGYGPPNYNVLMKEYGTKLSPKVYVYSTYLGNDPGDVRRYENWRSSGKGWHEYNGGYAFPIERRGLVWGWRLFIGRAKGFARNVISRVNPGSYSSLRSFVGRDDAETIFEYVRQAQDLASKQGVHFLVVIVPRTAHDKPLLDPVARKLVGLCTAKHVECLDLDPAFGSVEGREKYFAPDEHWNEAGMNAAWAYLWNSKLQSILSGRK